MSLGFSGKWLISIVLVCECSLGTSCIASLDRWLRSYLSGSLQLKFIFTAWNTLLAPWLCHWTQTSLIKRGLHLNLLLSSQLQDFNVSLVKLILQISCSNSCIRFLLLKNCILLSELFILGSELVTLTNSSFKTALYFTFFF